MSSLPTLQPSTSGEQGKPRLLVHFGNNGEAVAVGIQSLLVFGWKRSQQRRSDWWSLGATTSVVR